MPSRKLRQIQSFYRLFSIDWIDSELTTPLGSSMKRRQRFCDNSSKALVIKRCDDGGRGGGGQKLSKFV